MAAAAAVVLVAVVSAVEVAAVEAAGAPKPPRVGAADVVLLVALVLAAPKPPSVGAAAVLMAGAVDPKPRVVVAALVVAER